MAWQIDADVWVEHDEDGFATQLRHIQAPFFDYSVTDERKLSSPTYSYLGDGPAAIARAERGLRLSPLDPHAFWYQTTLTLAHYAMGNYAEAAEWGRKVAAKKPTFTANLRFLAASLAALGRRGEAHQAAELIMQIEPGFHAERFAAGYAFRDEERRRRFAEHLRLAGLPE